MKRLFFLIILIPFITQAQTWLSVPIDSNTAYSDAFFLNAPSHLIQVVVDTPYTSADFTFQIYDEKQKEYVDVFRADGTEVLIDADSTKPNRSYALKPTDAFLLTGWIKIRSGTSATPVTQIDDRILRIKRGLIE